MPAAESRHRARRRDDVVTAVLAFAAAVPALVSGVRAVSGRWATVIDNGVIGVWTHDALTRHAPLVGLYTNLTVATHSSNRLYNLGPLEFWFFSVPARLGGPSGVGMAVAAAVVNALALGGSVVVARRIGGVPLAAVVAAGSAVLAWSLGGQVLHDPWDPHLAIGVFAFLVIVSVAAALGDAWMMPVVVFVASFVVQLHLTYVVPAAVLLVWAIARVVFVHRHALRARIARPALVSIVVALACWAGPIVDQLHGKGNLANVIGAAAGGGYSKVGLHIAWRDLAHAIGIPPVWLTPRTAITVRDTPPSTFTAITALVVLALLVALAVYGWRRAHARVAVLASTALLVCLAGCITTANAPVVYRYTEFLYPRRFWWPIGVFVWIVLAYAVIAFVSTRRPVRIVRRDSILAAAALAVCAVAFVAVWPRLGVAQDYASGGYGPVRTLGAAAARALPDEGPWLVRSEGPLAESVVGPGVASELALRGKKVLARDASFPDFGSSHVISATRRPRGTVLVVSGPDAGTPRPGYRVAGVWDPRRVPAPFGRYHQTMLAIPLDTRIAVYVSR